MKKNLKYLAVLASVSLLAVTGCQQTTTPTVDLTANAPDYSHKKAEFITFGYTPPTDGKYYENSLEIDQGTDFRTKERYEEYKESGLNVLMFQSEDAYDYNHPFATSELKKKMDIVASAGIDKIIVDDYRIEQLCNADNDIISDDGEYITVSGSHVTDNLRQFKTIEDLSSYLASIMPYYYHDNFFGVILRDEPYYYHLPNWCRVYKAIKMFDSNIYVEGNLLPYGTSTDHLQRLAPDGDQMTPEAAYRWYLNYYLDNSGSDTILMDSYPFLKSSSGSYFKETHLKGLQIIGDICKERGVGFGAVAQTFGGLTSGSPRWDQCNAASMEWQLNAYMGFGCTSFAYFTYWRKVWNTYAEWFTDGTSFITNNGERTQLYYTMQTLNKELQKMAPVLTNYDFQASATFVHEPCIYPTQYADIAQEDFVCFEPEDFTNNEGSVALVTELQDRNNGQYLYMVENAMNPNLKEEDPDILMTFSIDFGSDYDAVEIYYRGERRYESLANGVYTSTLDAGYAEYIMPYKA